MSKEYFKGRDLSLKSEWETTEDPVAGVKMSIPTIGKASTSISYSIPSGAKIVRAFLSASLSNPLTGISVCTLNGGNFKGGKSVGIYSNSGIFTCGFTFMANGSKNEPGKFSSTLNITRISLEIEYEENEAEEEKLNEQSADKGITQSALGSFRVPPQSVAVYDQDTGATYTFDGVLKNQQALSLKIEEDPSKKKELYINNARNEPDKVTLDIMMSDVYTGGGDIISGPGETCSGKAATVLHQLKEERHMLTVFTPQYAYTDMLLQAVTINQDENTPFGWEGQVVFQEKYEIAMQKDKTSSVKSNSNAEKRTPSVWVSWVGSNAVPSSGGG